MVVLIFATRNGMGTLPGMLECLGRIALPEGLRIVAVDNGSTDGTPELLKLWTRRLPIEVLQFTQAGKNRALNFALDHLDESLGQAELVVISDDDILPDRNWLLTLSRAARSHPECSVFGGSIVPHWLRQPPEWLASLQDTYPILFASTTASYGRCRSSDIYGPNMAIRGRLFTKGLRFDPAIGPDGTKTFGMGSESELLRRLDRNGHRMFFCEDAIVWHQVKPALLEWDSILMRACRYGTGLAMMDSHDKKRFVRAMRAMINLAGRELRVGATLLPLFRDRRIKLLFWRQVARGYLAACLAPSRLRPALETNSESPSPRARLARVIGRQKTQTA